MNEDKKAVLAVELLLDREIKRPKVDHENRSRAFPPPLTQ